jgi:cholest-4-en-3-one 26-monooxygenase
MHVARIEISSLLRELLARCPDLEPAGEPERMASSFIAGVRHMPVRFSPS